MTKVEYKEFGSKEDLEFEFFKELDIDTEVIEDEVKINLNNLFGGYSYSNRLDFVKIVKIIERRIIGFDLYSEKKYFVFGEVIDLKVGDIINFSENDRRYNKDYTAEIFKIDEEVFNKEFLEECSEKLGDYTLDIDKLQLDVLKREDIEKQIKNRLNGIKETEETAKQEETDREKQERESEERYVKEGILDLGKEMKINKNVLEYEDNKFILKKNVNKVFDYEVVNRRYYHIDSLRERIIHKKVDFTLKIKDEKIYKVEFEKNQRKKILQSLTDGNDTSITKVNGVRVRKNKLKFVLDRINKDTTKKEVKLLNKLTGMKADLLELKTISLKDIEIDVKCLIIDENNFNIEIFGIKKDFEWAFFRDFFFYGGSSRSVNNWFSVKNIIKLGEKLGLPKQEVYDYLKKVAMLKELSKEDEK